MDVSKISPEAAETELKLDLTDLLGSGQVFAAGGDPKLQALMIDANCNKMGVEGGCCAIA